MTKVNLNADCKVKLTTIGVTTMKQHYMRLYGREDWATRAFNEAYRPDKDGYLHFNFHEVMTIFSACFVNGADYRNLPFVDNEIVFS